MMTALPTLIEGGQGFRTLQPTNRLRVLFATPLPPHILGGIEEYAHTISGLLERMGHEISVVTARPSSYRGLVLREKPYSHSSRLFLLPSLLLFRRPFVMSPVSLLQLAALTRNSDVVHIFMPFPGIEVALSLLAHVLGKPVLITYACDALVDFESREGVWDFLASFVERLYDRISAIPALVMASLVCTSSAAFVRYSRLLGRYSRKIVVVHQGIAVEQLHEATREDVRKLRKQLVGDRFDKLVTFVGRLVPYKGLPFLLRAFRRIVSDPKAGRTILLIGGAGPMLDPLRQQIRELGLERNASLLGYVSESRLATLLRASDIFVAPSVSALESTPIAVLQAMALGVPVVVTDVGGTAESVPNDGVRGIIVPAGDEARLADAIFKLLQSPTSKMHPVNEDVRSWDDVAMEYSKLYRSVSAPRTQRKA